MPTKKARLRFLDRSKPGRVVPLVAAGSFPHLQNFKLSAYETLDLAKRGDRYAQNMLIAAAVGISIFAHSILLAVRFVIAEDRRPALSPPLEVVLVNSKSTSRPAKAQVLAQANLDGGGNTDQNRRAKSPLPLLPNESDSPELSVASQRVQMLEQQAQQLLAQNKSTSAITAQPRKVETQDTPQLPVSQQELNQRMQEALPDFIGFQQRETLAQRVRIGRANRAHQHLTAIAEPDVLVPRGKSVTGRHSASLPETK